MFASPRQSAIGRSSWGFETICGGVDQGKLGFCPLIVGVVDVLKDIRSENEVLSFPDGAGIIFKPLSISYRPVG